MTPRKINNIIINTKKAKAEAESKNKQKQELLSPKSPTHKQPQQTPKVKSTQPISPSLKIGRNYVKGVSQNDINTNSLLSIKDKKTPLNSKQQYTQELVARIHAKTPNILKLKPLNKKIKVQD